MSHDPIGDWLDDATGATDQRRIADIRNRLGGPEMFPWYADLERDDVAWLLDRLDEIIGDGQNIL